MTRSDLSALPIDQALPEIIAELGSHGACVLTAPPGSGKTTRVPGKILDEARARGIAGEVVVLQPRRLAARAAARRVAFERGCELGEEVGYQVRHDRRAGRQTRLRFVTEGILLRRIIADPFLTGVAAVVLDEFHERSLESDLCLAMLAEIRTTVREDLLVVVMSATLDTGPVADFLAPCGTVHAAGRMYDVAVEYEPPDGELSADVGRTVVRALEETTGDVLVFLPGVGEIHACAAVLESTLGRRDVALHPLHGQLTAQEQDAAIVSGPRRKVVLATNVAETSITIDGVTAVVDSGQARILRHDSGRGLDRLELTRISRAAAEQRRGRAGRTGPGICYRLWSLAEERGAPPYETPEIRRVDLAGLALAVRAFAGRDPAEFGWFEAPDPGTLVVADGLLHLLGAVADGRLTDTGRAMVRHPVHPRLARMLEEGQRRGCPRTAAELAALLSERDIVRSRSSRHAAIVADIFALRELLHEVESAGFSKESGRRVDVDVRAARVVARTRDQIARGAVDSDDVCEADVVRTLVAGFPDRVCGRDDDRTTNAVMATGRGCRLTMPDHENLGTLFLALKVRESGNRQQTRALVALGCPLEEEWLQDVFAGSVREEETTEFDRAHGTVTVRRRRWFGRLVLDERAGGRPDPSRVEELFAAEVRRDPWRYLGEQRELRAFLARLEWLRRQVDEAECGADPWPVLGDPEIGDAAAYLCAGKTRLAELDGAPVLAFLSRSLPHPQRQRIERDAPERVLLPSGRHARIDYTSGAEPFVAARVQEFFGLRESPRLAGGRVPLVLQLLAPNGRPVQITSDLSSFWVNVYPLVRSELRRRYPKHSWPEDPLAARAESRPGRRRR